MKICRSCGICCYNTEMQLSEEDITRIEKNNTLGYTKTDFCHLNDDFYRLKNIKNHCIFLDPKNNNCKIYKYRPIGCRFYPMIFDLDEEQCLFDENCPHKNKFYRSKKIFQETCNNLKNWVNKFLLIS